MKNSNSIKIVIISVLVVIGVSATLLIIVQSFPLDIDGTNPQPLVSNVTKISFTQDEYEINLENSMNAKLMPDGPINKSVLSGSIFGFPADNGMGGGIKFIKLSGTGEKLSIRFTSEFSGKITQLHLYLDGQNGTEFKVGLQQDNQGLPSGLWLGDSPGYTEADLDSEAKVDDKVDLLDNVILKENEVYHIVVESDDETMDKEFMMLAYQDHWSATPFNYHDPDEMWPDKAINTLFFDGMVWSTLDNWPAFVVDYSDGLSYGQPYTLLAPWVIKENSMVGQTVRPFSNYVIDDVSFVVSLAGKPTDDLYYTIYDEENNILRNGTFAKSSDLSTKKIWHQIKLESSLTLESRKLYRFVLSSPLTDLENSYKIYGHEFMLDRSLGYGSVNHYLTKSTDGIFWSKWYDADTAFKLITK